MESDNPFPFEDTLMPFTTAQIAQGANYSLESYATNDPIDQINIAHSTLDLFVSNKEVSYFGNGIYNEKLFISNDSNYQNYSGADQVTYNERDPNRFAKFQYYSNHEGFWFDEDRLIAAGITIDDSGVGVPSSSEKEQLVNLLQSSWTAMKNGLQEGLALETLQNGSQSAKAVPGLDHIVSTTPGTGDIVGGINASTSTYWRNNASMAIASGGIVAALDAMWDACIRYGGAMPTDIRCGQAFLNAYKAETTTKVDRQIIVNQQGGTGMDPSITRVFYKGIELIWDPTFELLDSRLGAITYPWTKRCYLLNRNFIKFRPLKGHWMKKRKPEKLPDRYVTYYAQTNKYGMTAKKRNVHAVLSIA
ncbi:phage major capsid protein [Stenotrophomonas maltophilia]|uniref:phage major capsid protein n=2 Tax=Stenotrophomonas maltophilia TaxID=40324 RepID=UPI001EF976D2|nr:phage major capsid protein [Stenotrophomonas maltophilia]